MSAFDTEISRAALDPASAATPADRERPAGAGDPAYEQSYAGELSDRWLIGPVVSGGVVMALGVAAMNERMARDGGAGEVVAFSAVFLSASAPGPVQVGTETLRVGRRISTGAARVGQWEAGEWVERARLLTTHADLGLHSEPLHRQAAPVDMPPPQECMRARREPGGFTEPIALLDQVDLRLDPATAGFGVGAPTGLGELRGWMRFADGREPDAASLPFFLDAFPPVSFDLGVYAWAPTLEFTGHVRAHPAPGWLRVQTTTRNVAGGLLEEDCLLWDSSGRLVAQSRQLAGVRMPSPGSGRPPGSAEVAPAGDERA